MSRRIKHVRRSIKQRKKQRDSFDQHRDTTRYLTPVISEEEKHGYVPDFYENETSFRWDKKQTLSSSVSMKAFLSVLLFAGMAFILSSGADRFPASNEWLSAQLQEEFPFAKVNEWYVTTLGSPLALTPQSAVPATENGRATLPVLGHVVETFSANGTGIMISPEEKTIISAVDQGVVVFAGNDKETKKTITIQHADGSYTSYGYLSSIDVHLYQIVEPNQSIGSFIPRAESDVVYFSVEKDDQYIDPAKVIPVDDIP